MNTSSTTHHSNAGWTTVIEPRISLFHIPWKEIWNYRELVGRMVHRDFISQYKQTFFGSLWYVMQPLFTSLMFTLVFSNIARISTGGIPPILFYMSGTVCWTYFSACVNGTASTFISNSSLFDKVYFPRLVVPISQLIVNLVGFSMQMAMFLGFYAWYFWHGSPITMGWRIIVLPVLLLQMGALGLGVGCFVSAITTRFRDLQILLGFFIQLWMYGSCVVYPMSLVPPGIIHTLYLLNPMVAVIEGFRFAFMGQGTVTLLQIIISCFVSMVTIFVGVVLFNKTERLCVDIL
ncbi:MAG: ABC transporter permease [Chthoniobacterales bacterium]